MQGITLLRNSCVAHMPKRFTMLREKVSTFVPKRGAPEFERKTLGSYPISHDQYYMWKNKTQAWGGMITEQWSPHQLKLYWQFFQTTPMRWYARLQSWFWPVFVQVGLIFYAMEKIDNDAKELIKDKFWY